MIPSTVLGRYAKSLAEVVFEENLEQEITGNVEMYNEIFHVVPDILTIFHNPAIPTEAKEMLLSKLLAQYPVHPVAANFLRILLKHNRIFYFAQVVKSYLKAVNERKGIVTAIVSTASPLSQPDLKNLAAKLAGFTGKIVNIDLKTDSSLLGGIVVQVGSTVFDGSIKTQLDVVKRRLAET